MKEIISLIIPAIFLYIYIIFSSIEFGASVFRVFPKLIQNDKLIANYIQPVWEVTNVFLVFVIVSLFTFFPGATFYFGTYLLTPFSLGLFFLGLRAVCMLYIFYGSLRNRLVDIFFMLSSFLTPIILSNVFIFMLTGNVSMLYYSFLSLSLSLLIFFTIILVSSTFFYHLNSEKVGSNGLKLLTFCSSLGFLFWFKT